MARVRVGCDARPWCEGNLEAARLRSSQCVREDGSPWVSEVVDVSNGGKAYFASE